MYLIYMALFIPLIKSDIAFIYSKFDDFEAANLRSWLATLNKCRNTICKSMPYLLTAITRCALLTSASSIKPAL